MNSTVRQSNETTSVINEVHKPPGKLFQKAYLRRLSQSVNLNEITLLLNMEKKREHGLSLARAGQLSQAESILFDMSQLDNLNLLCDEAFLSFSTFQTAAQAYVEYRKKNIEKARELMLDSLRSCKVLDQEYGYDMEFRRVHLARNLIKLEHLILTPCDYVQKAIFLINYILTNDLNHWPISELSDWIPGKPEMSISQQYWSVDELLFDINIALSKDMVSLKILKGVNQQTILGKLACQGLILLHDFEVNQNDSLAENTKKWLRSAQKMLPFFSTKLRAKLDLVND